MGQNPVVAVIAAIVLIVAVVLVIRFVAGGEGGPTNLSNWYDIDKKQLYGAPGQDTPPMKAPSGGEGVKARVYANGSCDNKDDRFIGYLEKFSEATKAELRGMKSPIDHAEMARIANEGKMVKRPEDADWVEGNSDAGLEIQADYKGPPNVDPKPCAFFLK